MTIAWEDFEPLMTAAVRDGCNEIWRRMDLAQKPCTVPEHKGEHEWHYKRGADGKTPVYWCQCLALK